MKENSNNSVEEEYSWYVIICKANYSKKVFQGLKVLGYKCYLPLRKELRQWKDRKKWVEIPVLAPYLFVFTTEKLRIKSFEVFGIVCYLKSNGQFCTVSNLEVENLRKVLSYEGEVYVFQEKFEIGDEIEVLEGYFKGFRGQLIQKQNTRKLKLAIKEIDYAVLIDISHVLVKKV